MYEEKKKNYTLKDLAIQLLFIVLFVLILLWLFPTKKNMKNYVDKNGNKGSQTSEKTDNKNNNKKEQLYEYKKEVNGSYSDWSEYSDWSTDYVLATDLVDVETDVRSYKTGTTNKQVQVGTKEIDYLLGIVVDRRITDKTNSSQTSENTSVKYEKIDDKLYEVTTKEVYVKKQVPVYETKQEDTYGSVTYYRYRTRKKLDNNVDIKYSNSANDEDLINQGYVYTGNVKNA